MKNMNRVKAAWSILTGRGNAGLDMNGYYKLVGGNVVLMADDQKNYISKGYTYNDIVYSIINLITSKVKVAPWDVYAVKDEKEFSRYKALCSQPFSAKGYKELKIARHKAIELLQGDDKLKDLIKYPNPNQSWSDFIEAGSGFKLITGNKFIYGLILENGINKGKPQELHVLPSQYIYIINDGNFPASPVGYEIYYGAILPLQYENVLHEKYYNPDWNVYGSQLYGLSPLKAALMTIQRNNDAKLAGVSAFQNGGARGAMYLDNERIPADVVKAQTDALKRSYQTEYTGTDNYNKIIVSGYKLGWAQIGLSPVDMNLLESEKMDMRRLCNIYGVPSELLNDPDNKSFNNKIEAEKALTSRCALPLLVSMRESLNRKLQTDWGYKGKNIMLDFDMSIFTELNEDMGEQAAWLNQSYWLPLKMKYELQGLDVPAYIKPEDIEKIYIPNNLVSLDELLLAPDIQPEMEATAAAGANDYNKPKK